MYNTLGSSRLPVMSVGSSSSRSGPLRALALEPEGSLRAPAVPAAGDLAASPAALASAGATPAAAGVAAAGAFLLVSTAGSSCSGRGRGRAGAACWESGGFGGAGSCARAASRVSAHRSEEHTSELQSPCNLVCRLLLEKKKKKHKASIFDTHMYTRA